MRANRQPPSLHFTAEVVEMMPVRQSVALAASSFCLASFHVSNLNAVIENADISVNVTCDTFTFYLFCVLPEM